MYCRAPGWRCYMKALSLDYTSSSYANNSTALKNCSLCNLNGGSISQHEILSFIYICPCAASAKLPSAALSSVRPGLTLLQQIDECKSVIYENIYLALWGRPWRSWRAWWRENTYTVPRLTESLHWCWWSAPSTRLEWARSCCPSVLQQTNTHTLVDLIDEKDDRLPIF